MRALTLVYHSARFVSFFGIARAELTISVIARIDAKILVVGNSGILLDATVKEIVESDSLTKLALDCMTEVRAAAKTQAIDLDPALFDETLTFSKSLGDFKPSMLQDLEAGKPLEFEAFNGIVVSLLQKDGKAAPTNEVFYSALKYLDKRIRTQKSL